MGGGQGLPRPKQVNHALFCPGSQAFPVGGGGGEGAVSSHLPSLGYR